MPIPILNKRINTTLDKNIEYRVMVNDCLNLKQKNTSGFEQFTVSLALNELVFRNKLSQKMSYNDFENLYKTFTWYDGATSVEVAADKFVDATVVYIANSKPFINFRTRRYLDIVEALKSKDYVTPTNSPLVWGDPEKAKANFITKHLEERIAILKSLWRPTSEHSIINNIKSLTDIYPIYVSLPGTFNLMEEHEILNNSLGYSPLRDSSMGKSLVDMPVTKAYNTLNGEASDYPNDSKFYFSSTKAWNEEFRTSIPSGAIKSKLDEFLQVLFSHFLLNKYSDAMIKTVDVKSVTLVRKDTREQVEFELFDRLTIDDFEMFNSVFMTTSGSIEPLSDLYVRSNPVELIARRLQITQEQASIIVSRDIKEIVNE